MKNRFPGYFDLTEAEHDQLWEEGLIVIDTNVLLDFYRVPEPTRDRMFDLLASWKGRIWIPHQVGVEFLGMRVKTINEVHRRSTSVVEDMRSKYEAFRTSADDMKLAERGFDDVENILQKMGVLADELCTKASETLSGALQPTVRDHILDRIDGIVDGNVGEPPADQSVLTAIYKEGEVRYELKLGPGYADANKAERKGAKYRVGGLTYESQYSDLVLWKQTIAHVKATGAKNVLFVSKDRKKDWWQIVNGEDRVAPLPELREEMIKFGGAERFWITTLEDALAKYGLKNDVDVAQAVKDIRGADASEDFSGLQDFVMKPHDVLISNLASDSRRIKRVIALEAAAMALKLDFAYTSSELLGGRSTKNGRTGALVTTFDQIRQDPFSTIEKAEKAIAILREEFGAYDLHLVVVVPPGSSAEDLIFAESFGTSICHRLMGRLDKLIVGHVEGDAFIPYRDAFQLDSFL